jgi:hypothetical protein
MDEKPKTVTVESIALHTYNGKSYPPGTTYEIEEQYADSIVAQKKAVRKGGGAAPGPAPRILKTEP